MKQYTGVLKWLSCTEKVGLLKYKKNSVLNSHLSIKLIIKISK